MASNIGDVFLQSAALVDALPQEWDAATAPTPFPVPLTHPKSFRRVPVSVKEKPLTRSGI
jgi:hypothetical protein